MLHDLDELVLKCRDERARAYIREAVTCSRAGACRSTFVATWITPLLMIAALAFGVALLASCDRNLPADASPPTPDARAIYELREKCSKDAAEWFKREHGEVDTLGFTIQNEYTNHYSEKLNRCFALWLNAAFPGKDLSLKNAALVDVNENREVGKYFSNSRNASYGKCSVANVSCASWDEWHALATPYMEQ